MNGTFKGAPHPRDMVYWPFRDELYVGHGNGTISCFEVGNFASGPICKKITFFFNFHFFKFLVTSNEHEKEVKAVRFLEDEGIIVTASDDKVTKVN